MPLSESLNAQAIKELGGTVCKACGHPKDSAKSFCGPCFFSLPQEMRGSLYKTMSEGYPVAYDEAKQWLRLEK